ncbi:MAG: glutamate-5-semialdehyde dehydrogenase [Bacilli bacterium]|jgi:glutamate-5-semialdehyde dehydrogenase|nr:glutamate-5-semialdehyde dehydrogenase [Bacilli bacterium]
MNYLLEIAKNAQKASEELIKTNINDINNCLLDIADEMINQNTLILEANAQDVIKAVEKNTSKVLIDRLTLNEERIANIAQQLKDVVKLDSPLNKITWSNTSKKGFNIKTIRVPLGVVLIIYEARPNVTTEAMALCLKTCNASILRGSSSTINTNRVLLEIMKKAGEKYHLPDNYVQLVDSDSHDDVNELIKMNDYIDVVIPRGGANLINNVVNNSTVPVIETGVGNNFAYVDNSADIDKAVNVLVNAKAQRVSVCNSLEKILIDKNISKEFLNKLNKGLKEAHVEVRVSNELKEYFDESIALKEEDLDIEYLDYIIGIKQVNNLDEAISIINHHSTKHSNLILSNDYEKIKQFTNEIDAACVFVNTSTRFADGAEFGLGAEIGISNQKLHARGPMGLEALTSIKHIIDGEYSIK